MKMGFPLCQSYKQTRLQLDFLDLAVENTNLA